VKNIAGLDLSLTGSGVIVLDDAGKTLLRQTIKTIPSTPYRQRLVYIADTLCVMLKPFDLDAIVSESPALFNNPAVKHMCEVHGAVNYAMEKAGLPTPLGVTASTLKKFATGRGLGDKGDIKMWVLDKWGEKFSDNNQSDAYVSARIAGVVSGAFKMTSRHEGECLKTILNGAGREIEAKAVRLTKKDDRVCACGKKMKTGIEMESGRCADCIRKAPTTEGGAAQ
jgi:crossover junction endodeoxyribonuclease RuvC